MLAVVLNWYDPQPGGEIKWNGTTAHIHNRQVQEVHVERENKGKTENIYKKSRSVGSTNERVTQVSTPTPLLHGGRCHSMQQTTLENTTTRILTRFHERKNAYPLMLCWLADWARLPPLVLSAFCVQLGPEPQRQEVVEASEPCQKNSTH